MALASKQASQRNNITIEHRLAIDTACRLLDRDRNKLHTARLTVCNLRRRK
uniref:Uncharacterized protein n=1 Tax=Anguilla anguilla TaxID=7936 RepID=A0A0E9WFI9_ANGAN